MALYESTPRATYKGIAADLGISRGMLRAWVLAEHERRGADPTGRPEAQRPPHARVPHIASTPEAERIRQLETRIRALEASERKIDGRVGDGIIRIPEKRPSGIPKLVR